MESFPGNKIFRKARPRVALLCFLALAFILTGCSQKDNDDHSTLPENTSNYVDGSYSAQTKYYNDHGYGGILTLEVHQGIVTHVNLQELNREGSIRTEGEGAWLPQEMTLTELYAEFYNDLIRHQSGEIDTVTGATETSETMRALTGAALQQAEAGESERAQADFNQTYTASEAIQPGYTLSITFSADDTITDVSFDTSGNPDPISSLVTNRSLFQAMEKETMKNQSLNLLMGDPAHQEEAARYNALLTEIAQKRQLFPQTS